MTKMDKQSIKLYNMLKDEIDYIIKRIKKRPQTTKNNYGDYMNQIIELNKITNLNYKIISEILILGGGNVNVHGRIEGNNIVLVSDKATISRERFI